MHLTIHHFGTTITEISSDLVMAIFTILTLTFIVDMQVTGVDLTHFIALLHTMADFTILMVMDSETHGIDLVMRTVSGIDTTILTTEITTAQLHV